MFLKKVAVEAEDIELLGKATRLEIHIEQKSTADKLRQSLQEKQQQQQLQKAQKIAFYEQVKLLCIKYCYTG
jgi:hypothetical protein